MTRATPSARTRFTKMQGVGNDFVVVDAADLAFDLADDLLPALAQAACDRKFGVGADGLLVVSRTPQDGADAAFRMRMFNPDGSEDMCGNGLRCVSLWARRAGWLGGRTEFTVAVLGGTRRVRVLDAGADATDSGQFGVDMGVPLLTPARVPFCGPPGPDVVGRALAVGGRTVTLTALNTGSTHAVIFGPPPSEDVFQTVSPLLENHLLFPERTSVLWATPDGPGRFGVRIWERGAGETWGCGTGACAVGVAAVLNGLCAPGLPVDVVSRGGTLRITWPGGGSPVDMVGPAQIVFDGVWSGR